MKVIAIDNQNGVLRIKVDKLDSEEKAKEIAKIVSNINENILDKVQVYEETKNGKVYFLVSERGIAVNICVG